MGFKAHHPGIRLTVVEAGARRLQAMIAAGELDLSLAWARGSYLSRAEQAFVDFVLAHRDSL